MAIFNNILQSPTNFQTGFSPGVPFFGGAPTAAPQSVAPQQLQAALHSLLQALQQLSLGYQGFAGQPGAQDSSFGGFPSFAMPQSNGANPFQFYPSPGTPGFPQNGSGGGHRVRSKQRVGNAGNAGNANKTMKARKAFNTNNTTTRKTATQTNGNSTQKTTTVGAVPDPQTDFTKLSKEERTQLSTLNDKGRAALHLWGIQVTSAGKNDGGVYHNVLNNPQDFQEAEVQLAREMYNQEMSMFGGVNGRMLDEHFFGVHEYLTGEDISGRYANRKMEFAKGPVDMDKRLTGNNGLSKFDNTVIRLWGHDPLDNGANDGSITEFTLTSDVALDKTDGSLGSIKAEGVQTLLAADLADGKRDGSSLSAAFTDSLDRIYLGGTGASAEKTMARAGVNQQNVQSIIADWQKNPPAGIPAGVDITDMKNIGKCPVLGPMVTQQGGMGGMSFGL